MHPIIDIHSLAHGGDGIGRIEGQVCFVPFGLPGDKLHVRITKSTKKALWAEIEDILEPSPHRMATTGTGLPLSGADKWLHFAYPAQAEWKQRIVREVLERIAGLAIEPAWVEEPALRQAYRSRAEFHGDGILLGFYAAGTHAIVDMPHCPLCHARLNAALKELRELRLKGTVTVTVNPEGEEVLVWTKFVQRRLKNRFPLANSPKDKGPRSYFLFEGIPIVNGTFSQSSLLLNRLLQRETHEAIGQAVSLLDLYCGNGNLSLGLAKQMAVVGVDHSRPAVKAARRVGAGDYRSGGEDTMRKLLQQDEWDIIVLDPPRTGAKRIIPALAACHARGIVYVSCDPATLARDLKSLAEAGWRVTRATALDLFPHTPHIEMVCRLEKA